MLIPLCLTLLAGAAGCAGGAHQPPVLPDLAPVAGKADESVDGHGVRYLFDRDSAGRVSKLQVSPEAPLSLAASRWLAGDGAPAIDFLRRNSALLDLRPDLLDGLELATLDEIDGVVALELAETHQGLPIVDAAVRIVYGREGDLAIAHLQSAAAAEASAGHALTPAAAAEMARWALDAPRLLDEPDVQPAWQADGRWLRPIYRVRLSQADPLGSWQIIVDAVGGRVLETRRLSSEVTGRGRVWAHNAWVDRRTSLTDLPRLDGERLLVGQHVDVRDAAGPRAAGSRGRFDFPPSDRRFGEVMAYAHLDSLAAYLDGLGFATRERPLVATVHAFAEPNAFYDGRQHRLYFGAIDGFRAADDADVLYHELGHALVDKQVTGLLGGATFDSAIHEGYADYLACSFADDPYVGEALWSAICDIDLELGASTAACGPDRPGRRCDRGGRLPDGMDIGIDSASDSDGDSGADGGAGTDPHLRGMVVSAILWELRAEIRRRLGADPGTAVADQLAMTALRYLAPRRNQPRDLLDAMLQANRRLRLGLADAVRTAFAEHGIDASRR